jgi:hypothetical protein
MLMKLTAVALLLASATASAETTNSLSTGFDYSTGKYGGATSTDILYIPVIGKIQFDKLFLKLTVPYIRVTSAGGVVRGMGMLKSPTSTKTSTQSGLGDVIATAGYSILESDNLLLDLVGNVKFGTADFNKNLGTGENDYSAQLDGYYQAHKTTFFATAGYKVVGAPVGIAVNNIAYGTLGISQKTGEKTSAGLMFDAAQNSSALSPGTRELTVFVANRISNTLKIQANLMKGLSDGSPDYGGGAMVTGYF